jgi:hypothetical protein
MHRDEDSCNPSSNAPERLRPCGEFAFPHALLEQNLRILRRTHLRACCAMPLPSVVKELCSDSYHRNAPLPAEPPQPQNWCDGNKKPGIKRRAIPSTTIPGRTCSKLDRFLSGIRNQPHLATSGEMTGPPGLPGVPGLPTSNKYTYFPRFVK